MSNTTTVEDKPRLTAEPLPMLGEIQVVAGQDVLQVTSDPEFIKQWNELYEACPWATIFQSSRFVTCWYANYADCHTPILVVSWHNGRLTGLLAMADNIPALGIAGAGGYDAYYHVWLSFPALSNSFITESIQTLRTLFPGKDICLKYLPPNVPVDWITDNAALKNKCVTRQFSRPIQDISQVDEAEVLSRKQFREKNNRLKKFGTITFDVITTPDEFEKALEALVDHYDLRKAATYDTTPFRDDPAKKAFLVDLVKEGLLVAALLKVNDQVCAMLTATTPSKGWVHGAGIVVHNLKFSRTTPGYVIMKLFSVWLKNYPNIMFDITPGDHAYKNQHASRFDTLLELRVTNPVRALGFKSVYYAKEEVKKLLAERQIRPAHVKEQLQHVVQKLKYPQYVFGGLNPPAKPGKLTVWRLTSAASTDAGEAYFNQDSIAELLLYNEKAGKIPAKLFMSNAMHLYESGHGLYTYAPRNNLKCVVWVSLQADHNRSALLAELAPLVPADGLLLHGWHAFGTQPEEISRLLSALALQLKAANPSRELFILTSKLSGSVNSMLQPLETY